MIVFVWFVHKCTTFINLILLILCIYSICLWMNIDDWCAVFGFIFNRFKLAIELSVVWHQQRSHGWSRTSPCPAFFDLKSVNYILFLLYVYLWFCRWSIVKPTYITFDFLFFACSIFRWAFVCDRIHTLFLSTSGDQCTMANKK